jgi:hypothetical protein
MVYFQNKNPNLGKFWMALEWKMLVYCTDAQLVHLWPFVIFYGDLVILKYVIWKFCSNFV